MASIFAREFTPDVVVVGAGLAGLVTACELLDAGARVTIVDQESAGNLGGQAWWSPGGLFLVGTPEQRRLGVKDSLDVALQDWFGSAGFDRPEDYWPRKWARAFVEWAASDARPWLSERGVKLFPIVGWSERGGAGSIGPGNSVPRFHLVRGTGPALLAPFIERVSAAAAVGQAELRFRHQVDHLIVEMGAVRGVSGSVLIDDAAPRGAASSREVVGAFDIRAGAVVVASGGFGGRREAVESAWPARLGAVPRTILAGVPAFVDGRMLDIAEFSGAHLIHEDRLWQYADGVSHPSGVWPGHGVRLVTGPSPLWFDARGHRFPASVWPGSDSLGASTHLGATGSDHSWLVMTRRIFDKEVFAAQGDLTVDFTEKDLALVAQRLRRHAPRPVDAIRDAGLDVICADSVDELVVGMAAMEPETTLDVERVRAEVRAHDREVASGFGKDAQIMATRHARTYRGDRLMGVSSPHAFLDPRNGPLMAIRVRSLTRTSLGGIETNLDCEVLTEDGVPLPGLYAVGEAAGFGGGGMHGYRALDGGFLSGCVFTGHRAGQVLAGRLRH